MSEQAGQERDHALRHAGHFDEHAQEHEQRHGQQDQVRHAFVHAAHYHHHGQVGGQRQVAERRQAEGEGDGHAGEHGPGDDADEEDQQVGIAQSGQRGLQRKHQGDHAAHQQQREAVVRHWPCSTSRSSAISVISAVPTGSAAAPHVGDLQRGGGDIAFLGRVLEARPLQHQQKGQRRGHRHHVQHGPRRGRGAVDQRGHAHVFAAPERDDRAQHGQPEEQDGCEFVGPHQRRVQDVAGDDAGEQDDDLGDHQQGPPGFRPGGPARCPARRPRAAGRRPAGYGPAGPRRAPPLPS